MGVVLIKQGQQVVGIFTDGDLRRAMLSSGASMMSQTMSELMTKNPKTINENTLIVNAEEQMLRDKITLLVVTDDAQDVVGVLEIYDR